MNVHFKSDERILGDSDFVQKALHDATEKMKSRYRLEAIGYNFASCAGRFENSYTIHSAVYISAKNIRK